jgi:Holliday junction resolvase
MSTPEVKVKNAVKKLLKENNAYFCMPVSGGFGASGVPDIIACYRGFFIGIECKAGNNTPTALQKKNLQDIVNAGGGVAVINEDNLEDVEILLRAFDRALISLERLREKK